MCSEWLSKVKNIRNNADHQVVRALADELALELDNEKLQELMLELDHLSPDEEYLIRGLLAVLSSENLVGFPVSQSSDFQAVVKRLNALMQTLSNEYSDLKMRILTLCFYMINLYELQVSPEELCQRMIIKEAGSLQIRPVVAEDLAEIYQDCGNIIRECRIVLAGGPVAKGIKMSTFNVNTGIIIESFKSDS